MRLPPLTVAQKLAVGQPNSSKERQVAGYIYGCQSSGSKQAEGYYNVS